MKLIRNILKKQYKWPKKQNNSVGDLRKDVTGVEVDHSSTRPERLAYKVLTLNAEEANLLTQMSGGDVEAYQKGIVIFDRVSEWLNGIRVAVSKEVKLEKIVGEMSDREKELGDAKQILAKRLGVDASVLGDSMATVLHNYGNANVRPITVEGSFEETMYMQSLEKRGSLSSAGSEP